MKSLTIQFADADDAEAVSKYIKKAKAQDGTVGGLYAGLLCSALKRSLPETAPSILDEAASLIAFIGTTGVERGEVVRRAEAWLNRNGYEHLT